MKEAHCVTDGYWGKREVLKQTASSTLHLFEGVPGSSPSAFASSLNYYCYLAPHRFTIGSISTVNLTGAITSDFLQAWLVCCFFLHRRYWHQVITGFIWVKSAALASVGGMLGKSWNAVKHMCTSWQWLLAFHSILSPTVSVLWSHPEFCYHSFPCLEICVSSV